MKLAVRNVTLTLFVQLFYTLPAHASTSGPAMPWDGPLQTVLDSLTGTVAHVLITVAVVVTGLFFAFTEAGTGARKVFGVALGGALALGALSFMTAIGFAGACV
ncbi:MAG TPA: TrbC/VirB2 family protein [Oligoflexia bacterium]|nr:TrbC/VirB2 family protein [Oligoflexia bacterium]